MQIRGQSDWNPNKWTPYNDKASLQVWGYNESYGWVSNSNEKMKYIILLDLELFGDKNLEYLPLENLHLNSEWRGGPLQMFGYKRT